jgi:hypothetical protein
MSNKLFNGLPLYQLDSDGTKEQIEKFGLGLYEIAFTGNPAIGIKGVALNKEFIVNLSKDDDKKIVAGPALIPNYPMFRKGDTEDPNGYYVEFTLNGVRNEYEKFLINTDTRFAFNNEHTDTKVKSVILESWIIESEGDKAASVYGFNDLPMGTVFIVVKVLDDKYWADEVKANSRYGFSIQGSFIHRPVELKAVNLTTDLIHPNCNCKIEDGKFIAQEDCCELCVEARKSYNSTQLNKMIRDINNMDNF